MEQRNLRKLRCRFLNLRYSIHLNLTPENIFKREYDKLIFIDKFLTEWQSAKVFITAISWLQKDK
jgi:hypothetical protein